jgi:translocation and assembly module TamB
MPPRKSRARAVLGIIGTVVGTTVTFVTATAAAAVVHLNVPATRRLVATRVTSILHDQLAGDVTIEQIGGLGLRGVDGVRVRVKDPEGVQVLYVDGVRVRLRAIEAARSFLFGKGDINVSVDAASIEHADVSIAGDPAGNLRLANAFAARNPTPPTPPDPNARGVRVEAPSVRLTHAWVHGQAPGAPPADADLDQLVIHGHYDPKLLRADLEKVDLRARGLPRAVDPRGRLVGHFAMPSDTGKDMGLDARFEGQIAGVATAVHASMDGQQVAAVVDGRDATGEGMRATFGEIGLKEDVVLHAEAHGELPKITASGNVRFGRGSAQLAADVDVSDGTKVDAKLEVRHVDLRAIVPTAPSSDVGLDAHAHLTIAKSGATSADGTVDTLPGVVAGQTLPLLRARGDLASGVAHAVGTLVDPRGKADFEVSSRTVGKDSIAQGRIDVSVPDLARLPSVGGSKLAGHAVVHAEGSANLAKKTFDARAHVAGGGLAYGAQTVDNVTVVASAEGTLDHPVVDVGVHAGTVASGSQKIAVADVRARIEPGATTTVRHAHVDFVKEGITLSATAERVQVVGSQLRVDGAVVTGLGEPIRADVSRNATEIHMKVDAPYIDLRRVAVVLGRPDAVRSGRLGLNGDVVLSRNRATGELHATADSISASKIEGGTMALDAAFDGKRLDVDMNAELGDTASIKLATNGLVIGGSPLEAKSWSRAHGRAKFDCHFDMAKLAALVPEDMVPFSELRGTGVIAGTVRRDSGNVPPEMSVHVHSRGLVIAGKSTHEPLHDVQHKERVTGVQPWRSEGVDFTFDARVDGTSGAGEVALHAVDKRGTVAALDVKADLPYQEAFTTPARAMELLARAPISAKVVIPKRALAEMPELTGARTMPGTVEAELTVVGTALDPRVQLEAHGRGVRSPSLPEKLASDVDVTLTYDGRKGDLVATTMAEKHRVLDMSAHVELDSRDLLKPTGEPLAWTGSAKMKLGSFPLQSLGPLADRRIRGHVSGEASIDDLHRDARVHAQVSVDQLKVGRATYKSGTIVVDAHDGKLGAKARLDQTDGYADLSAKTDLQWGAALTPTLDPSANVEAHLEAKAFQAGAILPFVRNVFNELDGRIDADATARIGFGAKDAQLVGNVVFHDGTVQFASFGEELKDARAKVSFKPGGVITIDDVFMRSSEGELTAKGVVKTRGLGLATASASMHIPDRKAIDVSTQGQPIGAVSGDVLLAATASDDGKLLKVQVDVPKMKVVLPQRMKSGLQELGEKENIRVGTFRDPKTFVRLPLDKDDLAPAEASEPEPSTVIDADIRLGDITVTQGSQVRVVLGGSPHVHIAKTTEVSGQVEVKQGKIDVQGKEFEIEKGTVTFQPDDTSNPVVVATAAWTAEDGSKIYADFVGPVKTGKVNLRSDPARPKNEILAMILFGTADGANAAPPPPGRAPDGTTKAATSLGGGFAAQGLTEAMDDLTGIQATARIDTTRSANPAPEIEIQIARRISLAFEHILGTPPLSEPDTNLAIVDWRFRRNWSLETTLGDRGKVQTDAVWTKRY